MALRWHSDAAGRRADRRGPRRRRRPRPGRGHLLRAQRRDPAAGPRAAAARARRRADRDPRRAGPRPRRRAARPRRTRRPRAAPGARPRRPARPPTGSTSTVFGGSHADEETLAARRRPARPSDHALLRAPRRRRRSAPPATSWPADVPGCGAARSLPEARHTGVYRALLDHRLRAGVDAGCRMALVKGRVETSAPVLLRAGFAAVRRGAGLPARPRLTCCSARSGTAPPRPSRCPTLGFVLATGVVALVLVLVPGDLAAGPARRHRRPRGRPRAGRRPGRPPAPLDPAALRHLRADRLPRQAARPGHGRDAGRRLPRARACSGCVAALLLADGRSVGLLWLLVLLAAALILWVRNGYGLLVLLRRRRGRPRCSPGTATARSSRSRRTSSPGCCCWPRRGRWSSCSTAGRRRGRTSDPDQLAGLTRVPAVLWILLLLLANLAGLVVGVSTLAPDLV